jgi:hypothetical protein
MLAAKIWGRMIRAAFDLLHSRQLFTVARALGQCN